MACGGGELSVIEYSETVEALAIELSSRLAEGDAQVAETPTIETARNVITQALDPRAEFQEAMTALEPPDEMADLHSDMVELHARIITAQTAFATQAETAPGLDELDRSEQAQAYRAVQTESASLCQAFQARIDAIAANPTFGMESWVPGGIKDAVEVTFGC
jgi:hypothetical protein